MGGGDEVEDDFGGGGGFGVDELYGAETVVGEVMVEDQDAGGVVFEVVAEAGQLAVGGGIDDDDQIVLVEGVGVNRLRV